MNNKNALGFLILGLLMTAAAHFDHTQPGFKGSVDDSVRSIWIAFMGWVTGGIGMSYLTREAIARAPLLLVALLPERLLHPVEKRDALPAGSQVAISN